MHWELADASIARALAERLIHRLLQCPGDRPAIGEHMNAWRRSQALTTTSMTPKVGLLQVFMQGSCKQECKVVEGRVKRLPCTPGVQDHIQAVTAGCCIQVW